LPNLRRGRENRFLLGSNWKGETLDVDLQGPPVKGKKGRKDLPTSSFLVPEKSKKWEERWEKEGDRRHLGAPRRVWRGKKKIGGSLTRLPGSVSEKGGSGGRKRRINGRSPADHQRGRGMAVFFSFTRKRMLSDRPHVRVAVVRKEGRVPLRLGRWKTKRRDAPRSF